MPSVFLSHNSRDKAFARKLASMLEDNGVNVWIDEAELKVGDSLIQKIGSAIEETDFVAVVLSPNSVDSTWVKKELAIAMERELSERKVTVLPILKEPCDIPPFLKDKIYANFTRQDLFETSFSKLLRTLGIEKSTRKTIPVEPEIAVHPRVEELTMDPAKFKDIKIIGIDSSRTYKPDPNTGLYNIYFELSDYPPSEWVQIFDAERRFPRHSMWREAWVEGKYIVVYCPPDEVKRFHLNDIKYDTVTCNVKYKGFLEDEAAQKMHEIQKEKEEKAKVDSAFKDLNFE